MATKEILNGVPQYFGPADAVVLKKPGAMSSVEQEKTIRIDFDYANLPAVSADDVGILTVPAHAKVISAELQVTTAFAGGTSYNVGFSTPAGSVVDADGLFAALALAAIDTKGKWALGAGALVGTTVGSDAVQVTAAATGTFTAGAATLFVKYKVPVAV